MCKLDRKEGWRIDAFELLSRKRLLRVPWMAWRSSQSILKEINPEYSLEELMLKLKLQYFGHVMWRAESLKKILRARGEAGDRGWDGWMASPTQWTLVWVNSWSWWWTGNSGLLQPMGSQSVIDNWVTALNWPVLTVRYGMKWSLFFRK